MHWKPTLREGQLPRAYQKPCLQCGYNVFNLGHFEPCPECGLLAQVSLDPPSLLHSDQSFVRRLALGALLIAIGVGGMIIALASAFAPAAPLPEDPDAAPAGPDLTGVALGAAFGCYALHLVGWLLLLSPEAQRSHRDGGWKARRIARLITLITLLAVPIPLFDTFLGGGHFLQFAASLGYGGFLSLLGTYALALFLPATQFFTANAAARTLALRLGRGMREAIAGLLAAGAFAMVFSCVGFALGPVFAAVFYCGLYFSLAKRLWAVSKQLA